MSEPPDLSVLAKRYVELWQDYLTAAAADPGLADNLARLLAGLGAVARELVALLADVAPDAFAAALDRELRSRADVFLRGLEAYRHHPYQRVSEDPPVVWREGTTRLLDY